MEGGGRLSVFDHEEYRIVVGLKGQLSDNWSYDAFMQYGSTSLSQRTENYFVTSRINNALRAERNAAGQIVCSSVITGDGPGLRALQHLPDRRRDRRRRSTTCRPRPSRAATSPSGSPT